MVRSQALRIADGQLDRIEVGRVRRKIEQPWAYRFDRFLDTDGLVDWNIVHDHDIAAPERGSETLLHVSEEHRPVHRALDNGATIARIRRPATKVIVFQCPSGA